MGKRCRSGDCSLALFSCGHNLGTTWEHLRGGLSKIHSTHLQAEASGGEGGDAAGQDGAPERGFALLVLIRTQPARLVLLPYSRRKEVGGAGQSRRTKRGVSSPTSPGGRPQPRTCPAEMKPGLAPWSGPWVPGSESGNLRLDSWLAHALAEQPCANSPNCKPRFLHL